MTGGSRGIGAAVARAFAAGGDRVAVHYRDAAADAEAVRAGLPGEGHVAVRADLADATAVRAMVDEAADRLGGLDVLVNNAGIYLAHPVMATSYEEWQDAWRATLSVNLIGAANATWCAVRHMTRSGRGGRIVNVGSRGAFRGEPAHPAYGASKAGLHAFGQSLAVALAPHGITVASVAPGYVATDMTADELATAAGDRIRAQSPFNRVALPEEVAAAVVYLASPEASWASGAVLDLNGASYLRLAGTAFGKEGEPPGDRAVADLGPVPEAEPLSRAEERGHLVVGHGNRHLGPVPRVQGHLVVPAELGRKAPAVAGAGQALRPDHEGVSVVGILPRRPRLRPLRHSERVRPRRNGVECDQCQVLNLPHSESPRTSGQICSHDTSSLVPRYSCLPGALPGQDAVWQHRSMDYVLAQVNVGRLVAPLDSPLIADFVAALDPVNAMADASPGFVWRLQTEDGNATAIRAFERDAEGAGGGILINMSVWESVETLGAWVYGAAHLPVLRRRREWFERMKDAYAALWWIPRGHIPTVGEAEDRVTHLRRHGPTPRAFTLREHFPPPDSTETGSLCSPEEWTCPA